MSNKKSMRELLSDFRTVKDKMTQLQAKTPIIIGEEAVKIVKQNFDLQGYDTGHGVLPWKKRSPATDAAYNYNRTSRFRTKTGKKSRAKNRYKGSTFQSTNPLLEQTRTLKRSVTYFPKGKGVTIGVDLGLVVYAQKMNEGGAGKWGKSAKTNTPARQYMPRPNQPPNPKILKAIAAKVKYEQDKILTPFKR